MRILLLPLSLSLSLFACAPSAVETGALGGGNENHASRTTSTNKERIVGVVEVRPTIGGGYAASSHGVGWIYSEAGKALQQVNWSDWQVKLDSDRCWFHESLERPFGDEVFTKAAHVCFAVLKPAAPPVRFVLAGMEFSDGSGMSPLEITGGSYSIVGTKTLYESIDADCWGVGNPFDRVSNVTSAYDPSLTRVCENEEGTRFTYFAFLGAE